MMRIKVFLEIIEHPISLMHILNNILITDKSCLGLETKQYEKSMEVLPKVQILMIKLEAQAIRYFLCEMESCKL